MAEQDIRLIVFVFISYIKNSTRIKMKVSIQTV